MKELKLKAIVLSSINYKEKDKILTLFSLNEGLITANLRGVRSAKAKLKFAGQPFCFGDFLIVQKNNMNTIISVDIEDSFFDLTKNINTYYLAFGVLETVKLSLMQEEANSLVFINTLKALKLMCYDEVEPKLVLTKFIVGMLKVLGYGFNFKQCDICSLGFVNHKYLNMSSGALHCGSCVTHECKPLSNAVFNSLKIISGTQMDKINTVTINKKVIDETLKLIIENFENRVGKTYKTIRQISL